MRWKQEINHMNQTLGHGLRCSCDCVAKQFFVCSCHFNITKHENTREKSAKYKMLSKLKQTCFSNGNCHRFYDPITCTKSTVFFFLVFPQIPCHSILWWWVVVPGHWERKSLIGSFMNEAKITMGGKKVRQHCVCG